MQNCKQQKNLHKTIIRNSTQGFQITPTLSLTTNLTSHYLNTSTVFLKETDQETCYHIEILKLIFCSYVERSPPFHVSRIIMSIIHLIINVTYCLCLKDCNIIQINK